MHFGKCVVTCAMLAACCASDVAHAETAVIQRQRQAMGTTFVVLARAPGAGVAAGSVATREALDAALDEVTRLDRVMSHYDDDSELSRLVRLRANGPVEVSADLYGVLDAALTMSRRTQGRFDVTVGRLVQMWRQAADEGRSPSDAELAEARACAGPASLALLPERRVHVRTACVAIDLGGIAKGLAVDRALRVLAARGILDAMVNAGGSTMAAMGAAGDDTGGWPVQLHGREVPSVLADAAVSTSQASRELVVPATGQLVATPLTVTVVMRDAIEADAWSTALLLATPEEGAAMLREVPGAFVTWTDETGRVVAVHERGAAGVRSGGTR